MQLSGKHTSHFFFSLGLVFCMGEMVGDQTATSSIYGSMPESRHVRWPQYTGQLLGKIVFSKDTSAFIRQSILPATARSFMAISLPAWRKQSLKQEGLVCCTFCTICAGGDERHCIFEGHSVFPAGGILHSYGTMQISMWSSETTRLFLLSY